MIECTDNTQTSQEVLQCNHNSIQVDCKDTAGIIYDACKEDEHIKYKVCISGIQAQATYSHPKCLTDILDG